MRKPLVYVAALALGLLWSGAALASYEGDPDAARPLNEQARQAYAAGNFAQAAPLFEQAFQAYQHPEFLYNRAQCLRRAEQHEQAIAAYQRYTRAGGQAAVAHIHIGECLLQLNRRDEATRAFRRYLELQPEGPHAAHAREAVESGRPPSEQDSRDPDRAREAQEYYDRVLRQYNRSEQAGELAQALVEGYEQYNMPEFLHSAAIGYHLAQQPRDAVPMYRRYLQTPAPDPEAWAELGDALAWLDDTEGMLQAYRRYLQLAPRGERAEEVRDLIAYYMEPSEEHPPREHLQEAREAVHRGQEHYDAGRVTEALREFQSAYERAPDRATLFNIAMCYTSLRNWREAAPRWVEYAQGGGRGRDAVAHLFAAQAFIGAGNPRMARGHLMEYLALADQHELPNEAADRRWAEGMLRDVGREAGGGE